MVSRQISIRIMGQLCIEGSHRISLHVSVRDSWTDELSAVLVGGDCDDMHATRLGTNITNRVLYLVD